MLATIQSILAQIKFRFTNQQMIRVGIIICLLTICVMWEGSFARRLTFKEVAPNWIVSLKFADDKTAAGIKELWKQHDLIGYAVSSLRVDMLMIVAYTTFFLYLIRAGLKVSPAFSWVKKILIILCVVAAFADVGENVSIFFLLKYNGYPAIIRFFGWTNAISFGLVAGFILLRTLIHIGYPFNFYYPIFRAARLFMPGLIIVILCYVVFTAVTIGEDMVLQVGEYDGPFFLTLVCTVLCACYCWYSTRVVGNAKKFATQNIPVFNIPLGLYRHIPRLIGLHTLVAIQGAVICLPGMLNFTELQLWMFVILHTVFYFVCFRLYKRRNRLTDLSVPFIIALLSYCFFAWIISSRATLSQAIAPNLPEKLAGFVLMLFVLELALIGLFMWRRSKIANQNNFAVLKIFGKSLPIFSEGDQFSFTVFNIGAFAGVVIYLVNFISIGWASIMGPLATILLMFGILTGVSNILSALTITFRVNFFILLFILAIVMGRSSEQYAVRISDTTDSLAYSKRQKLDEHFQAWTKSREQFMLPGDTTFDAYVVIADGGASRSGYWVSSVLSALQDLPADSNRKDRFGDHVYCLTGTSGGGVGVSTYYAMLRQQGVGTYSERSDIFLRQDFLTPIVSHYLGTDLLQHVIPLGIEDRAAALERAIEHFDTDSVGGLFDDNFSTVIDTSGTFPILFINTTQVQQGAPAVISTIQLDGMSRRIDVLDTVAKTYSKKELGDIRLSTAAILGARFPFVSPAGGIGDDYFVDGGYFDNTGAGIVHEMMQRIDSIRGKLLRDTSSSTSKIVKKLRFRILYLSNGPVISKSQKGIHPLVNEMAAPVLTVLGTYTSQTSINNERLFTFMRRANWTRKTVELNLYTKADTVEQYPMNWVISDYNLYRMRARLEDVKKNDFKNLKLR